MRLLVQRVSKAEVEVRDTTVGRIGPGLVLFMAVGLGDTLEDVRYLADKVVNLRIFPDEEGRLSRSALGMGMELLVVSQFTLYADVRRGRRPNFSQAALPKDAEPLFISMVESLRATGLVVATGQFAAHMTVVVHNDGPVTIILDSHDRFRSRGQRS